MKRAATILPLALLLATAAPGATARAEDDLALREDCAAGFQRFMRMAEDGALGADVATANVSVEKTTARIELVRRGAANKRFLLTSRRDPKSASRYFDIAPEQGATAADLAAVGAVLDRAFPADPFAVTGTETIADATSQPTILSAWRSGGWQAALRTAERRMMSTVSVAYTVAVIVGLAFGTAASLVVLWSPPPRIEAEEPASPRTVPA
jgi:hypothetical protein